MQPLVLILFSVFLGVAGQLLLKAGVAMIGPLILQGDGAFGPVLRIAGNRRIWGGLFLYGVSMLLWLVAISRVELGYAYPFISLSYVLILVASWALFKEKISLLRLVGVAAICLGVVVVAAN
ncbi:MAG TPA: EamA family transporter [Chloroflexota bacterium]|nr:EamA family transporter [Chloroflexota bacterium]